VAKNPIGRNYDVSQFSEVIPVGEVPFSEFIPTLFECYWLRSGVPRVLTPDELARLDDNSNYYHGFTRAGFP